MEAGPPCYEKALQGLTSKALISSLVGGVNTQRNQGLAFECKQFINVFTVRNGGVGVISDHKCRKTDFQ